MPYVMMSQGTAKRIRDLLAFFAAREVNVHGEPPNVDFVVAAKQLCAKLEPIGQADAELRNVVGAPADKYVPNDTLEDKIMDAWHITDDLDVLFEAVMEDDAMTRDEIANIVLGLRQLYARKFDRLFRKYEDMVAEGDIDPFPDA